MKPSTIPHSRGFTLLETVIAIGVLAVLLTGFLVVFTPATDGIRKSINTEHADRLASALEQELVNVRPGEVKTNNPTKITLGFRKAFDWIRDSNTDAASATTAILNSSIFIYHYRRKISESITDFWPDGTLKPEVNPTIKLPGKDYVVVPMVRRGLRTTSSGTNDIFADGNRTYFTGRVTPPVSSGDLPTIEGALYLVKCTQLIFKDGKLVKGTPGRIVDPKTGAPVATADDYPGTTLSFVAEFYMMPTKTSAFYTGATFIAAYNNAKNPVFTRHLSVRR